MARVKTNIIQAGGKTLMLDTYEDVVPPHDVVIDVFSGSAALLLWDIHPKGAIYNDFNEDAANYWRCVRDRGKYEELLRLLRATEYGRKVLEEAIMVRRDRQSTDIRRAWAWAVHMVQGFTHTERETSFRMVKPPSMAATWARGVDRLPLIHRELQNVGIECLDWRDCLKRYGNGGERQLVLLDPPYLAESEMTLTYKHPFTFDDHVDLLVTANRLDNLVMIFGYDSALYSEMLRPPKWEIVRKVRVQGVKNSEQKYGTREECIWVNRGDYRNHAGTLWAQLDEPGAGVVVTKTEDDLYGDNQE